MNEINAVRTLARLARLLERAETNLSFPQYRVLAMVADGDQRASHLAECLAVAKPTVTAAVDGLVERGFVERQAVPGDRRAARITVTAAGRTALAEADAALASRLEPVLDRLGDRRPALAALAELGTALDGLMAERMTKTPAAVAGT